MEYKASLDTFTKIITTACFVLFVVVGQKSVGALIVANGDPVKILIHSGTMLLLAAVLIGSWLYAPQSYTVDSQDLIINRPIGKIRISFRDIKQVRRLANSETKGTIRIFGVGGLFGYFGRFYTPGIGRISFYATQRKNNIRIVSTQDMTDRYFKDRADKLVPASGEFFLAASV